jgi:hypothetical protein
MTTSDSIQAFVSASTVLPSGWWYEKPLPRRRRRIPGLSSVT